ncbi:MAG: energy transducer TonB [Terriglobia bacterium]
MLLNRYAKYIVLSFVLLVGMGGMLALAQESKDLPEASVTLSDSSHKKTQIVHMVKPAYPPEAKKKGIEGLVKIDVTVNTKGEVIKTKVVSGPEELREAALTAVRQWRYKPLDADFIVTVDVNYQLAKKPATPKS